MNDMLTGMPVYTPSGDVARAVAREMLYQHVKRHMERDNLTVSLGELAEDGTVPLTVTANPEQFDFATYLEDHVSISGVAWIEDRASTPIHVWYAFEAQDGLPAESNYADAPPVAFWLAHARHHTR